MLVAVPIHFPKTIENLDIGAAQRAALAQRAHDTHRNRPDPRYPLSKSNYWTAGDPTKKEQ